MHVHLVNGESGRSVHAFWKPINLHVVDSPLIQDFELKGADQNEKYPIDILHTMLHSVVFFWYYGNRRLKKWSA
jgi:hypothetical protein